MFVRSCVADVRQSMWVYGQLCLVTCLFVGRARKGEHRRHAGHFHRTISGRVSSVDKKRGGVLGGQARMFLTQPCGAWDKLTMRELSR